ncbi:MAG: inositol monophosphatase family protein [Acidimicrobiales bacterium]
MAEPRPTAPPDDELLDELTSLAVDLARGAGALLMEGRASIPGLLAADEVATKTSSTDMVSEVDRASEQLLVGGIVASRPGDGILGEEGADRESSTGVRWVIDPLDGTTNYLYGLAGFAVSIGVEHDGRGVVGVVLDPVHDELFAATVGRGATCNGAAISCTGATDLAHALVGTGFGYRSEVRAEQAEILRHVLPRVRDIRRFGAAAVDLCAVACGRLDGYYERGLQPWDLAAGIVIAAEAGAVLTGAGGGPAGSSLTLAAGPGLHGTLRDALIDAGLTDA